MKRTLSVLLASLSLISLVGCNVESSNILLPDNNISALSTKDSAYPFDVNKDFFPLYNQTFWKYDVFNDKNQVISTLTKTLDVSNENSVELDNENKYYVVGFKNEYSNPAAIKDTTYDYFRRKDNQVAYGKTDNLTYYPDPKSKNVAVNSSYDPYQFRPFVIFNNPKLEQVKVKAGTFQCVKSEFTLGLDKYIIWHAKGIGEVKRIKESLKGTFRFELSEYNNTVKQFAIRKETLEFKNLPANISSKAIQMKADYLRVNQLPENLFEGVSSSSILIQKTATFDHYTKTYEIRFINKSIISKNNVNLLISSDKEGNIKGVNAFGENNDKPMYNGKVVDKLPAIIK